MMEMKNGFIRGREERRRGVVVFREGLTESLRNIHKRKMKKGMHGQKSELSHRVDIDEERERGREKIIKCVQQRQWLNLQTVQTASKDLQSCFHLDLYSSLWRLSSYLNPQNLSSVIQDDFVEDETW